MKLSALIDGLDYIQFQGDINLEIQKIDYDSRHVKQDGLFVCIQGFNTDGHQYIDQAIQSGAKAVLVSKEVKVPSNITIILVKDTRHALAYVSDKFYNHPSSKLNVIGITGTKGKTTTTYMIKKILETYGQKVGLIGTIQNSIGNDVLPAERTTPESLELQGLFSEMTEKSVDSCVMEVSSHALELHRVSCTEFSIGIFTNLSRDHLDFHETFENYFKAKQKIFSLSKKGLLNLDCEYGKKLIGKLSCEYLTYSVEGKADIVAQNIELHSEYVKFNVATPNGTSRMQVNIPGKFTIYNALAAIGAGILMNIPLEIMKEALQNVKVPGRAEVFETGKEYTLMIDYAHTPDSLENILSTVKNYAKGRVVSVFGCGGDRDTTKRPIMGEISGQIADFTIITSDNPRSEEPMAIISQIEEGIKKTSGKYITIGDRKSAIRYSMEHALPEDSIVICGKGHETYQIFKDKTIDFDEREVVKDIIDELKAEGKW